MEFDIQYLLLLQDLRSATGGIFNEFFNSISKVAVDLMPLLSVVIFWCVDKKWGYRFFATYGIADLINGIIKLSVCAYRPWIRSDLIEPAGDSKVAATGYSFPSGHTTVATAMYGTTAVWQYNKRRWLSITCIVLIALTGFSRNFLGVHTPQDVCVGLLTSILTIFLIGKAQGSIENNDSLKDKLTILSIVIVIMVIIYIQLKPYPMDYVNGTLLVDPQKMMNDTFKACGSFLGFTIGCYIERHYIKYEIPESSKNLPIVTCVGIGIVFAWHSYFRSATIIPLLGGHWGNFAANFIQFIFAISIYPIYIKKFCSEN